VSWRSFGVLPHSPLRRLDVRAKLAILGTATLLALIWESPALTGALALTVLVLCQVAGIQRSYLQRLARLMAPLFLIVLVTHGLWNTSVARTILWTAPQSWPWVGGSLALSAEGLAFGAVVIFRTLALVLAIPLVILTTDLNALIVGLVRLRIPYRVAFIFSATLRFVPLLLEEIGSIREAQRLRGLAVESMGLGQRLQVYGRIAVPLILGAMTRSQQVEVVLASRAFSGSPERTYLYDSVLRPLDWLVIVLCTLLTMAALVLRITTGLGRFV